MTFNAGIEAAALKCADELVAICEAAARVATRTGNTFVLDRRRVSSMIAGHFSSLTRPSSSAPVERREAVAQSLPCDVVRLVNAARLVAFTDQGPEAIKKLDEASEAFASRVPWDDEPEDDAALIEGRT